MKEQFTPDHPEYWNESYEQGARAAWNTGAPAPPLRRYFSDPKAEPAPPARIFVPGCGHGHEVVMLAKMGYNVTGVDLSPLAIEHARTNLGDLNATLLAADFFDLALQPEYRGAYDAVVEYVCFCSIRPGRREEYVTAMANLLRPGGLLVGLFFNTQRPGGPPFDVTANELRTLLRTSFEIEQLGIAPDSIKPRAGRELIAVMRRNASPLR
ncbi:methyltransferase domain-containing protein [bacterium]|nr:methyltransferase domain-containing protein [bacterium]